MFSIKPDDLDRLIAVEPLTHRATALRHAAIQGRPRLLGDHPRHPRAALWFRPGNPGTWEAFATGEPDLALDWLAANAQGSTVALLAPGSWDDAVRQRRGTVESASILTFLDFDRMMIPRFSAEPEVLKPGESPAFEALASPWALRSWGDFDSMVEGGLAIGLRSVDQFVSVAWTYESIGDRDKIGVATHPRYQGLGLAKRVAGALIERIVNDRGKLPVWVTTPENAASVALAKSLGFANPIVETLLRWTPDRE